MERWLYPGSFDPPHHGHLDLIRRAAARCGELVVAVAGNPEKSPLLPVAARVELLRACCVALPNVRVVSYDGATAHWAAANGVTSLVRGIRSTSDLEFEGGMAHVHHGCGLETVFLLTDPRLAPVTSRLVRQMHAAGLPFADYVPPPVHAALIG